MISQKYNLNSIISKLINIRKIKESSIDNFFNNNLNDTLPEPYVLIDMELAVNRVYESIIRGEENVEAGVPESFNVLVKEMRSLGLNVELQEEDLG